MKLIFSKLKFLMGLLNLQTLYILSRHMVYRVPTASYKSYNLACCHIFVLYLGE